MNASDRPVLSPLLVGLFPPGVVVTELAGRADRLDLPAAEAAFVAGAAPERIRQFAAGRACARLALAQLGITDFVLRVGPGRQPLWPLPVVGSITHAGDFCAAAAAERATFAGLGIDTELAAAVAAGLWPKILSVSELDWLQSVPAGERPAAATLLFSAKEAFYKCQFPRFARRISFHEVQVRITDWGTGSGSWEIRGAQGVGGFPDEFPLPLTGRFRFHGAYVSTGVAYRAVNTPDCPGTP